jgi:hypothetical protein
MHKTTYAQEINRILATINNNGSEEEQVSKPLEEKEKAEEYDVYVQTDRITIVKRPEPEAQVIEAVQLPQRQPQPYFAYIAMTMSLLLLCYLVTSAIITVFIPQSVTITLLTKSRTVTATGTLRVQTRAIPPITLSESQTVQASGKGHQDARSANGYITFYNGEFQSVTIPAGKTLTGSSGVTVITDQDAIIPAANINPPTFGQATVSAHALNPGQSGNIPSYDINSPCCFASVIAKNPEHFTGGQDERNFQTVAKADIDTTSRALKTTLAQSVTGALQSQLKPQEQLELLPCTPTVSSDHQPGQEAREVKVSVSETCSAVVYNYNELISKATDLLSHRAHQQFGTGYSLIGPVQVSITQVIKVTGTPPTLIYSCQGTWVYAIAQQAQQHIKHLIAGKSKQVALKVLLSMPGIERVSIEGNDNPKLPKNITSIHFQIIVQSSE